MSKTLEDLGYKKRENDYYVVFHNGGEQIAFDKLRKEVVGEMFTEGGEFTTKYITMGELKAIYQCCIDNKWI